MVHVSFFRLVILSPGLNLFLTTLRGGRALLDRRKLVNLPEVFLYRLTGVKHMRRPLPAHLPREERKILPKREACPDCGGRLKPFGEDVSEILEYIPEHFKVIRQVRPKLACEGCDKIV
jgi:uncharacterized protein with PIN domain